MSYISELIERIVSSPMMSYYYHNPRSDARAGVDRFLLDGIKLSKGEPFSILPPHDWGAEKSDDREWLVLRNAFFHVDWMFQAYLETGVPRYLYLAGSNLIDWVTFNLVHQRENRAKWSDICTGLRAFYYAFAIDRCSRESSCHHMLPILIEGASAHARELMRPEAHAKSNHAIFQGLGLSSIGFVLLEEPESKNWRDVGRKMLEGILFNQYGNEGVHLEHSPYYHGWVLQRLKRISDVGLFDSESGFSRLVKTCAQNYIHFFRPDGSLSEIGDSSPERVGWMADMDPALRYAASGGQQGIPPSESDAVFREAGYLIFRDSFEGGLGSSHLICHAGHHIASHKHDDDLTIEWSERGRRILVDAGKLSYDYNERRDYVLSRRAHNVTEINGGAGFDARKTYGAADIQKGVGEHGLKFARVTLPFEREGCRQTRVLILKHGRFLVVVDAISTDQVQNFVQWFHYPPQCKVRRNDGSRAAQVELPGDGAPLIVGLTPLFSPSAGIILAEGQADPLQGWISPDYAQLVPAPALGVPYQGGSALLASLLDLREEKDEQILPLIVRGDASDLELGWCWSENHRPTFLRFNANGLSVDGPIDRDMP